MLYCKPAGELEGNYFMIPPLFDVFMAVVDILRDWDSTFLYSCSKIISSAWTSLVQDREVPISIGQNSSVDF